MRVGVLPFAAIVLAMLPAVLDQTILATALPFAGGSGDCAAGGEHHAAIVAVLDRRGHRPRGRAR